MNSQPEHASGRMLAPRIAPKSCRVNCQRLDGGQLGVQGSNTRRLWGIICVSIYRYIFKIFIYIDTYIHTEGLDKLSHPSEIYEVSDTIA